jgi:hypothetical protein
MCFNDFVKPLNKVAISWSPEFAYAIGLLVTDGCLYSNGRMLNLTSKDEEQISNFMYCLGICKYVGKKSSGSQNEKRYFNLQFGDIMFCKFLNGIGIMPSKTKTIGALEIPNEHFFDFLRGHYDGDGTFYSYWDSRWRSSYMFYTVFTSASKEHILWLRGKILDRVGIGGHIATTGKTPMYQLRYAKSDSLKLLPKLYYNAGVVCLSRKRRKIEAALAVIGKKL